MAYSLDMATCDHSMNNSTSSYFQYDGFTSRLGLRKTKGCSRSCTGYVFYEHLQFMFLQVTTEVEVTSTNSNSKG